MIEAQIQYAKLQAISRQMGENLQRISRSPLVSQNRAFATAIFTSDLKLAVQHQDEAEHLFALKDAVQQLFHSFSYDIAEGDIFITADPYNGGTRGQTMTMAAPLFHEGKLILFPAVRVQMTDLAGEYPGGLHPNAFEVWQESMRLTPVKLYRHGILQRDVQKFLLANSRVPTLYQSELEAMYSCLRSAQEQITSFFSEYGSQVADSIEEMLGYSRRRVIEHISQLPDTKMHAVVPFSSGEVEFSIRTSIQPKEEQLMIDFEGTSGQVELPLNTTLSAAKAFAVWPILAPLADELPFNEGVLDPFLIKAEAGSLLNPAFPAAVGFSTAVTGHFISAAIAKALNNGKAAETTYAEIHGPEPQGIFFPPFGKQKETEPLFLFPGYPESVHNWGPSGLFGNRNLNSAEELEFYYNFKMIKREMNDNQQMEVLLLNQGSDFNVNIIIPENKSEDYGTILIHSKGNTVRYEKSTAEQLVKMGDKIEFHYSRKGGNTNNE
ncbi:methylhydantoinase [Staphylococcus cohnii]|uniref:Methylhydantoinase n=1 Tax=Staphylococcus cohnii TaxID=29382 RepID=A0A2T4LR95_9STAP|nr:hydantoinase B/oxoprolinase family protein [Staphylococcus cohnii]PTF65855.1 methylhydantoinase [Staphylococcus cohnii]